MSKTCRRDRSRGRFLPIILPIAASLLTAGCATTERVVDTAWTGTKNAATTAFDATKGALEKLARYTKIADLLRKNHDSANHDDASVVEVIGEKEKARKEKPGRGRKGGSGGGKKGSSGEPRREILPPAAKGELGWPVEAGIISSEYGQRWGRLHKGIDIAADVGEPILAAADGEVIYSGNGLRGYGNVVILRHDSRMTTLYAHNSALKVKLGERVKAGSVIALLGSTGHSTGPHCHFEIRDESQAVDPRLRLAKSRIFDRQPKQLLAEARKG